MRKQIKTRSTADQYDLFLEIGVDQEPFQENIKSLLHASAQEHNKEKPTIELLHILLPNYFKEAKEQFTSGRVSFDEIPVFLQKSAQFYRKHYERCLWRKPQSSENQC